MELLLIVLSVLVPPVGVFFRAGLGKHFWINLLLTLFGYFPGLVHAIWYIGRSSKYRRAH